MSSEEETSQTSSSPSSPPPSCSSPPPASHFIGKKEDIVKAGRVTKLVNGCRDVLVLHHQGRLHAMDMRCYRKLFLCGCFTFYAHLMFETLIKKHFLSVTTLVFPQTDSGGALQNGDIEVNALLCTIIFEYCHEILMHNYNAHNHFFCSLLIA